MRMSKVIVFGLLGVTAAVIAATMWRGECVNGTVADSEAACRAAGLPEKVCREAFARADALARATGPLHNTRGACEVRYPTCLEASHAAGWVPRPAGYCIVADRATGGVGRLTPVYRVRE